MTYYRRTRQSYVSRAGGDEGYQDCDGRTVFRDILVLNYVYSKQPIFGLTQEWLREVWSPRQGICLFTPCVGYFTSPGIDTR